MSVRIIRDIEEALAREVRRITFSEERTETHTVLKDAFDPFTGELISLPVEPEFYDSSADAGHIQYPHFFISLLKSREDRFTKRVVPQYGKTIEESVPTAPKGYTVRHFFSDGAISVAGNTIGTSDFHISKVVVGDLLRIRNGNNIGTYYVKSVTKNIGTDHIIEVEPDLVIDMPELAFNATDRTITALEAIDLNTVKVGDIFNDSLAATFNITAIDIEKSRITIDGATTPDLNSGAKISRSGDIFQTADTVDVIFTILDPNAPLACNNTENAYMTNYPIPLDLYYLIRIDSKERDTHVDILNRMWEEFNPPRTGLPTIVRTKDSAETTLTQDGGSSTITVEDNSEFDIGETVFIFDDLTPSKDSEGDGFEDVLEATILEKSGTDQLILSKVIPSTFTVNNNTKIVSNALYVIHFFHFVDHITKNNEGAQYWVHEFTFWIQVWVARQGEPTEYNGVIQKIATPIEDLEGNVIIDC